MDDMYVQNEITQWDDEWEQEEIRPAERTIAGESLLTAIIWFPGLLVTAVFTLAGMAHFAVFTLAITGLVHTIARPAFPVYLLLFVIPLDWMVSVIAQVTTTSKIIAVFALVVSLPKILSTITKKWDTCAYWIAALIGWAGISMFWSNIPTVSFIVFQTMVLLWVGLPLLLNVHLKTRVAIRGALLVFVLGCLISSIAILATKDVHSILRGSQREHIQAIAGDPMGAHRSEDPNILGRYMAVAVLICLYMIFTSRNIFGWLFYTAASFLLIVVIIILKGRAVYVSLPGAILMGIVLLRGAGLGKRLLVLFGCCVLAIILMVMVVKFGFFGEGIQKRFESVFTQGVHAGRRWDLWKVHMQAFSDTAWLGRGLGMMRYSSSINQVAHNDWIDILGNLGIVGFIAFLGFHATLFVRIRRISNMTSKMFCLMVWCFIILAGMTQTDYKSKYYLLSIIMVLLTIRYEESYGWQDQRVPMSHDTQQ
jgi:hypothetical protein